MLSECLKYHHLRRQSQPAIGTTIVRDSIHQDGQKSTTAMTITILTIMASMIKEIFYGAFHFWVLVSSLQIVKAKKMMMRMKLNSEPMVFKTKIFI